MRRAFTLIELLVVIAIIAILAAILFPVFAQAKLAAKKTVAISNAKQQGLGLLMYAGDADDLYPRNDACVAGSSLNPKFLAASYNATPGQGCLGPYYNRLNNYSWQKWIMPYVKSTEVFFDPLRVKDEKTWSNDGELFNQFLLNNGLTGSLYVSDLDTGQVGSRGRRNAWYGGSPSSLPRPADAMILMEVSYNIGAIPAATDDSQWNQTTQDIVAYPIAFREYWKNKLNKTPRGVIDCYLSAVSNEVDDRKAVQGGVVLGLSDGHAKFTKAGEFLAKCPTKLEMVGQSGTVSSGYTFQNDCHGMPNTDLNAGNLGIVTPKTNIDYPMWGFGG